MTAGFWYGAGAAAGLCLLMVAAATGWFSHSLTVLATRGRAVFTTAPARDLPLMGPPDPIPVRLASPGSPSPPGGTSPAAGRGRPLTRLDLSRDAAGAMHATLTTGDRVVAIFAVDATGSLAAVPTDGLLAELQARGELADVMERLHWNLPLADLLAEVARRAQRP